MSQDINNIHDKFGREIFSDRTRVIAFMEQFLPTELLSAIDLDSLQITQESYMTENLKEYFSDLVFLVGLKDSSEQAELALLFEHKMKPEKYVLIQVGNYMFSHWSSCISKKTPLRPIIPIIYYQGSQKWVVPTIAEIFGDYPKSIQAYQPSMPHILLPLNEIPEDKIMQIRDAMMIVAILAQKIKSNPTVLAEDIAKILNLFPVHSGAWNFLEIISVYILRVSEVTENQLADVIQQIPNPIKDNVMSTYDMLIQKGEIKGKLEGKLEGQIETNIKIVLNCLENELDISLISNISGLTEDEVKQIIADHK